MPKAVSLAAAIKASKGVQATLLVGEGGAFEVKLGDRLLFSKLATERFPTTTEVLQAWP